MWNRIADLWCRKMHGEAMWPIHGKYVCKRCLREYPVAWDGHVPPEEQNRVQEESNVWLADHH